ncbi:MAG: PIG-L family deacetylase [Thermoproteota archaeon]
MDTDFTYYDLREGRSGKSVGLILNGWRGDSERLAILSPHDDDAILGAMYLSLGAISEGARVHVIVLCDGRGGYSTPGERESIVSRRRAESANAYSKLGIEASRMEYPDFSLSPYVGWILPGGTEGTFPKIVGKLREIGATRLLVPNEHLEHPDHEAASRIGIFDGPQAGDPVVADLGEPVEIRSYVKYSVWSDFAPFDALLAGRRTRADCVVRVSESVEKKVVEALGEFGSQRRIIEGLVRRRKERLYKGSYLEPYLRLDPRPPLPYNAYKKAIEDMEEGAAEVV